jgi:hypothetical protein
MGLSFVGDGFASLTFYGPLRVSDHEQHLSARVAAVENALESFRVERQPSSDEDRTSHPTEARTNPEP